MKQEKIEVQKSTSGSPSFSSLFVSVQNLVSFESCKTVIGYPGLPNVNTNMHLGDAVLYETTADGILEIRATKMNYSSVEFTITHVSPRSGLGAGIATNDPNNLPFTTDELKNIYDSFEQAKLQLANSGKHTQEQLDLINRKFDDIYEGSTRLGRKDWLNYCAGSLTSLCIAAAFSPEMTNSLFKTVNLAFSWLFTNTKILLMCTGAS